MSTTHYTVLSTGRTEEHNQWQTPVTVMLIGQAEKVLCPQGHTTLQRHAEGEGEGDGLFCMSLPQLLIFPSHCPSFYLFTLLLAILAHCTDCSIYITLRSGERRVG